MLSPCARLHRRGRSPLTLPYRQPKTPNTRPTDRAKMFKKKGLIVLCKPPRPPPPPPPPPPPYDIKKDQPTASFILYSSGMVMSPESILAWISVGASPCTVQPTELCGWLGSGCDGDSWGMAVSRPVQNKFTN